MSSSSSSRRASKWHPPPPPTPKILHLPRRIKLRSSTKASKPRQNLRSLFTKEKITMTHPHSLENNSLKIEINMLRAECNLLRMERDSALMKLEKTRERKKIDGLEKKMGELKLRADKELHNASEIHEINVEKLKRKMDGISKEMKERMEEYGSFFISPPPRYNNNNNNNNSKFVVRSKNINAQQVNKWNQAKEAGNKCCCHCREIAGRIAAEVKAEAEQWGEMQEMLERVRIEMEDLKSERDLWQRRAMASQLNFCALHSHMLELEQKQKAQANDQQNVHCNNKELVRLPRIRCQQTAEKRSPDYSAAYVEKEKRVLVCRLNNSKSNFPRRSALQDIGNLIGSRASSINL